ncbi:MAG: 2,3-bisphosphoglycerate-independent phosphoglycerate mutase [Limnochordia bacterium]|jgi:2,3-bisphosphoglycerate-independent phosphoglycerate mutase|nr:2,3-bisphosphoglycerate-independent phosphoglycerate mutase [Limnochordia bacterium]MDI9464711.1 2,3-bisphosphoglycerate-independent phosphoglycerate mutase [Bacillota bacterium]NLO94812.1 2,3-bisphosphoglycerate-independent phosphoglycerate mutase [Bacillota bacterium]HAI52193.1 2,3-bisphosphoglycerate-independent phosphoglycerate mutase [Bacillota bacterium]HAN94656.1 2,3-bisphosphoglycerate-independent phosphoglycerate mutase [Bacillota bacterium]
MKKPTALIILDGFGLSEHVEGNAVKAARTPTVDWLNSSAPRNVLSASGGSVGLMDGQMGDSNVGHLNIGAGRIVYQDVVRISKAIASGEFFTNPTLLAVMEHPKKTGGALHLMGLVSPGGVHSHSEHLYALLRMAKEHGLERVFVHAFLDGRDVPPSSAHEYLADLEEQIEQIGIGRVASISGRYYAMDRDRRWDRVEKAYRALLGQGPGAPSSAAAIQEAYAQGETDEFVVPRVIVENGKAVGPIQDGDSVLFFNFRADRAREITWAMTNDDFQGFDRGKKLDIYYATMTQYDAELDLPFAFAPQDLRNTLGEYLSGLGKTQLRIAETEKYAHVTFFFNGGQETPFPGEERILVPSPKVPTYDLQPEMSAPEVTRRVVEEIRQGKFDFIVLNYANCDMVGHTGVFEAAVKAVEAVDAGLGQVLEAIKEMGGTAIVTADHGNAEQMVDPETGEAHTAHTSNLVPVWLFNAPEGWGLKSGILADLAPSILDLMGIAQPPEMTGQSLIVRRNEQ